MSIQKPPDARDFRYLKLVSGRHERLPEEEIAKQAGEESPTSLYERIKEDGHPICPKCGTTYVDETHCEVEPTEEKGSGRKNRTKNRPRSRTLGPARELPPPGNATPLFRERLEALLASAERLKHMEEDLRGEYFVRTDLVPVSIHISRKRKSEEVREATRKQYDLDPDDTGSLVIDVPARLPGGVAKSPSEALAILIGVYALAGGRMELLVDALQRDPPPAESEVWNEIRVWAEGSKSDGDKRDGLKVLARGLATWVRGSRVSSGRPPELSKADHDFACSITRHRKDGLTDEEIARRESHRKKVDGSSYSVKDVTRLGNLGLS